MQMFIAEVMANVRANVASLGGNGLVSYRMNQCVLMCNPHKNQVIYVPSILEPCVTIVVFQERIIKLIAVI